MSAIKLDITKCRTAILQKRSEIQEAESALGIPTRPGTILSRIIDTLMTQSSTDGSRSSNPQLQLYLFIRISSLWDDLDSIYQNLDRLYSELGRAQDQRAAARTRLRGTVGGGNADPTWGAHQNLVHSNPNTPTFHALTSS